MNMWFLEFIYINEEVINKIDFSVNKHKWRSNEYGIF